VHSIRCPIASRRKKNIFFLLFLLVKFALNNDEKHEEEEEEQIVCGSAPQRVDRNGFSEETLELKLRPRRMFFALWLGS
jgi:hypothetical protein